MLLTRAAFVLSLTLATAVVVGGIADAASSANAIRTPRDVVQQNSSNMDLSTIGGAPVTIVSVALPPGVWALSFDASVVNFGPSDFTRCGIYNGSTPVGGATTMVGNNNLPGSMGPG